MARPFPESYDVADRLVPGTVLRVRVDRLRAVRARGRASSAHRTRGGCGNQVPVQFDGQRRSAFPVPRDRRLPRPDARWSGAAGPTPRPARSSCARSRARARGEIQTVFVDAVPPAGRIDVSPSTGLSLDGETVTVEVHDYPPGARVTAMLCAAPDATGSRCGDARARRPRSSSGRDGTGRTELASSRHVSASRESRASEATTAASRWCPTMCSPERQSCRSRSPRRRGRLRPDPSADRARDRRRSCSGSRCWLIFCTDWSAVGEAAAPEIDDAEYADLDAIIAALPPEEEELAPRSTPGFRRDPRVSCHPRRLGRRLSDEARGTPRTGQGEGRMATNVIEIEGLRKEYRRRKRSHDRGRRARPRRARRRGVRLPRAERLGQDHDDPLPARPGAADEGIGAAPGQAGARRASATRCAASARSSRRPHCSRP